MQLEEYHLNNCNIKNTGYFYQSFFQIQQYFKFVHEEKLVIRQAWARLLKFRFSKIFA